MFYEHFRAVCAAHGKSPSAVALAAGMSKSNVTGWKNGQSPSIETLKKLAAQLGINPKELIPDDPISNDTERTDQYTVQ